MRTQKLCHLIQLLFSTLMRKNVLKTYRVRKYAGWQVKNNAVDNDWTYVEHEIKVK